eukprot:IDg8439t1
MLRSAWPEAPPLEPAGGKLQTLYHPIPVQQNVLFQRESMVSSDEHLYPKVHYRSIRLSASLLQLCEQ